MKIQDATIGQEVVRAKGDYVVGRVGNIIAIDAEKNRAKISYCSLVWRGGWISFSVIEPTTIPYKILPAYKKDKYTWTNPKYIRL